MRTMILFTALVACSGSGPEASLEALDATPRDQVQQLRLSLHEAQRAWSEGRKEEAAVRVPQIYAETFAPLEPLLRTVDAVETLQLEYRFGSLAQQFARTNDALAVAGTIQAITRGTDALVAALPEELAGPVPETAPVQGPRAETAELPPHLR